MRIAFRPVAGLARVPMPRGWRRSVRTTGLAEPSVVAATVDSGSRVAASGTWPAARQPSSIERGAPGEEPA